VKRAAKCGSVSRQVSSLTALLADRVPSSSPWRALAETALGAPLAGGAAARPFDAKAFVRAYASASRHLGRALLEPPIERPFVVHLDELARVVLLERASEALAPAAFAAIVHDTYGHGDSREKAALLRALPLLPEPARFLEIAVDACRVNEKPLFEAIACDNPFPAAHFPELAFNQMVLKALFIGAPLARVAGLDARITPELRRMADGYASERRAAGRPVPADIDLIQARRTPS
jgi:hypothetical protein